MKNKRNNEIVYQDNAKNQAVNSKEMCRLILKGIILISIVGVGAYLALFLIMILL